MGGGKGFGAYGGTRGSNRRERFLATATNPSLRDAIGEIYRPGATVGDGGVADAIRHEKETGQGVGGSWHSIKGRERLKSLEKILKREKLNKQDTAIAKKLIADLQSALGE